ncbi:MAG: glycosyltransferase family 4 protein, partial [Candidatus Omnitrophica bacterium]|nr:glycosyltransferase family 4 protein [Candidatus Omnitrophota bacterium]
MKIAFFSWEAVNAVYVGGVAVHVSELAQALTRKGHEVHIFTRIGDHQSNYGCVNGVHYHRCHHDYDVYFPREIENMCRSFLHAFLETEDHTGPFDIIHAHDWLAANAMVWIKNMRDRKSIFTMHSTEYGRCGNNRLPGSSDEISTIEWFGIYHADEVIAVSDTLKKELVWLYGMPEHKGHVIYNGVDYHAFDGWIDSLAVRKMYDIGYEDPMILFAGRVVYQKGPDILAECVPDIVKHYHNAKFVFAGDGGMRMQVEDRLRALGVHGNTRFLGHQGGWRLQDLFKTCDCVCVPSRNEPFGIVILEAWAAGKPVVASVNGGPSEFVWHDVNGYKVKAEKESINWGLGTLLEDREHAAWMGRNGRHAVETIFSWDAVADET